MGAPVVVVVVVLVVVVVKNLAQSLHKTGQRLTTNAEAQSAGAALEQVESSRHWALLVHVPQLFGHVVRTNTEAAQSAAWMFTHCGSSTQPTVVVGMAVVVVATTVVSVVPVPVVPVVVVVWQLLHKVGQMLTTNEDKQSTHVAEVHEGVVVLPAASVVVEPEAGVVVTPVIVVG